MELQHKPVLMALDQPSLVSLQKLILELMSLLLGPKAQLVLRLLTKFRLFIPDPPFEDPLGLD